MHYPTLIIELFFWTLTVAVLLLPRKEALFAYLLLAQVDASGPFFSSSSSLGIENLLKIVVIPTILFLRSDAFRHLAAQWSWPVRWWIALTVYASVAIAWSPAPLSGVKMVGYLYSYLILFLVYKSAWAENAITFGMIEASLWCVFAIGLLQTYVLGNPYGTLEMLWFRFTTFSSPQALAVYFLAVFAMLMDAQPKTLSTFASLGLAIVGIVVTGSRYIFLGLFLFLLIRGVLHSGAGFWRVSARLLQTSAIVLFLFVAVVQFAPQNRLNELFESSLFGGDRYEEVATVAWRLGIYQQAFDDMSGWSVSKLLIGAGTSAGGNVKTTFDPRFEGEDLDANRSMHNEFLRAWYEWGLLGLAILILFLGSLFLQFRQSDRMRNRVVSVLSFSPAILLSLGVENILSNPGGPGGTAIVVLLAYGLVGHGADVCSTRGAGGLVLPSYSPTTGRS